MVNHFLSGTTTLIGHFKLKEVDKYYVLSTRSSLFQWLVVSLTGITGLRRNF